MSSTRRGSARPRPASPEGVSVMVPPTAALSSENVMDELAVPPSTMLVAADRLTVEGPSTMVSNLFPVI